MPPGIPGYMIINVISRGSTVLVPATVCSNNCAVSHCVMIMRGGGSLSVSLSLSARGEVSVSASASRTRTVCVELVLLRQPKLTKAISYK